MIAVRASVVWIGFRDGLTVQSNREQLALDGKRSQRLIEFWPFSALWLRRQAR